jgi:hypothetical protein
MRTAQNQPGVNPIIQYALDKGLKDAQSAALNSEGMDLRLTATQEKKLDALAAALGLSFRSMVVVAIKYALFDADSLEAPERKKLLRRRPKGATLIPMALSYETIERLKRAGLEEKDGAACAVAGLELLYERLMPRKSRRG